MVGMGMGTDDPADATFAGSQDRFNMLWDSRPGVNHRQLIVTKKIRVSARAGHHARVGRYQAAYAIIQAMGHSMLKHRATPCSGSAPAG